MFQGPASQIITGPSGHDNNDLAAFLQAGQHGVCKPVPVFLLGQLVIGLLSILDEVIDNEQRSTKAGGCAGRGRGQVVVVAALQTPEVHGAIAALNCHSGEDIGKHNPIPVRLLLLDIIADVLGEHGG